MLETITQYPQGSRHFLCRLSGNPAGLAGMRSGLRSYLVTAGVANDVSADVILAAHEATANALRFSGDDCVELRVSKRHGEIHVSVKDRGKGFDTSRPARCADPSQTQGRGLYLMRSLMDDVSIECSAGTTVKMRRRYREKESI